VTGYPSASGMRSPLENWSQPSSGSVSFVTAPDAFRDQPVLTGQLVRLEPLTLAVLEDYVAALAEPEVRRLTGAPATFDRPKIEAWLATRGEHHDRADWAVVRAEDGAFLGEAVLNQVDLENESANYRVWLAGSRDRRSSVRSTEPRSPSWSSTTRWAPAVCTG
jgi:RimJ/RimL family protein N-acetyltransferase